MITNEEKAREIANAPLIREEECNYAYICAIEMAEWKDSHITEQQVKFQCINKEVTMTVGQLIDYYIEREICDVAEECGF